MAYQDADGRRRGFVLTLGRFDEVRQLYGVDLYQFPKCFEHLKRVEILKVLWSLQGDNEPFHTWLQAHRGDGAQRVCQSFGEALDEFLPEPPTQPLRQRSGPPVEIRREAYRLAGLLGVNSKELILRELVWMIEGRFPEFQTKPAHGKLSDLGVAMGAKIVVKTP